MDNKQQFDVVGVGNAIVDIISLADDKVLDLLGLSRGSMMLVDEQKTEFLYNYISCIKEDFLTRPKEMSGGCAANTVAGITSFGGSAAFIGKISDDYFGERFASKLHGRGVHFDTPTVFGAPGTARSLIIVTQDDASRTMCTFLGAAVKITEDDIDEELISKSSVTFIEAYLLDCEHGLAAVQKAMELAHKHGKKIGFTLSDSLCVKRHYDDIIDIIDNRVDYLFANKREINALFSTTDHDEAVKQMSEKCQARNMVAALTTAGDGVVVLDQDGLVKVPAAQPEQVIDTTGAGDMFVSGFLYGHLHGYSTAQAARLGNLAAIEVLKQLGARPKTDLSSLLHQPDIKSSVDFKHIPHCDVRDKYQAG